MAERGSNELEQQLTEMQRKYRMLEGNQKKWTENSQYTIRRQRLAIEKLKADNAALKEELAKASKAELANPPASLTEKLDALHEQVR